MKRGFFAAPGAAGLVGGVELHHAPGELDLFARRNLETEALAACPGDPAILTGFPVIASAIALPHDVAREAAEAPALDDAHIHLASRRRRRYTSRLSAAFSSAAMPRNIAASGTSPMRLIRCVS
jgi:hypothetical protein